MGLFGKKKDFWDEVKEPSIEPSLDTELDYEDDPEELENPENSIDDGRWHPTKSMPLKVIARLLLFVSTVVLCVSGYVVYSYFNDGGTMDQKPEYYESHFFGREYQKNMEQLIRLIQAFEKRGDLSEADQQQANIDLIDNYLTMDGNFSFVVYDEKDAEILSSSEDAVSRIEGSNYFTRLDTTEEGSLAKCSLHHTNIDVDQWMEMLEDCSSTYTVYAAVDNELAFTNDGFYDSLKEFETFVGFFDIAKPAIIAAAVVFVLMLIFCIISTGNVQGYDGIQLTWFDKIFTEIALLLSILFSGGSLYGAWYFYHSTMGFAAYAAVAMLILAYIFIVRSYFSMVRRIKAGKFISNMAIYYVFEGIGKLPTVPKILLMILVIIGLNGALIFLLFKFEHIMIAGIPVVYILVPFIFIMENLCFITWIIRKGKKEYDENDQEEIEDLIGAVDTVEIEEIQGVSGDTRSADVLEADLKEASMIADQQAENDDWEHMDLGPSVDMAIGEELPVEEVSLNEQTVLLPKEEIESLLGAAENFYDSATSFEFIQLNKEIRKLHRNILKNRGITVTLRAPEKPIILEMNKEDMWKAISMIYDNLEQYTDDDSRIYAEMYTQNGKMIYLVKNAVKPEYVEAAKNVIAEQKLEGGLKIAKEIVEKNHGKFVVAMDGNIFKTGILLNLPQE